MADTKEKVVNIVFKALENLNAERSSNDQIPLAMGTALFGGGAALDSLSLVSVIVDVETALSTEFGEPVALTDDRAMSREVSPFTDVAALTDYILELLSKKSNP
jgi:acyl carrier protein